MKKLSEVTKEDALAILSVDGAYKRMFLTGKWQLTDESAPEKLNEPCVRLSSKRKVYSFYFFNDRINVDLEPEANGEYYFDDTNFDCKYQCYIKAHQLGYYIPLLTEAIQDLSLTSPKQEIILLSDKIEEYNSLDKVEEILNSNGYKITDGEIKDGDVCIANYFDERFYLTTCKNLRIGNVENGTAKLFTCGLKENCIHEVSFCKKVEKINFINPKEQLGAEEVLDKLSKENRYDDFKHLVDCADIELNIKVVLQAMHDYASQVNAEELKEEINKLRFMIDNGLGWDDMKNDITYPRS